MATLAEILANLLPPATAGRKPAGLIDAVFPGQQGDVVVSPETQAAVDAAKKVVSDKTVTTRNLPNLREATPSMVLKNEDIIPEEKYRNLVIPRYNEIKAEDEASKQAMADLIKAHAATALSQPDLTPLMALSDSLFGGKMAESYKRPKTMADYIAESAALEQAKAKLNKSPEELYKMMQGLKIDNSISTGGLPAEKGGTETQTHEEKTPPLPKTPSSSASLKIADKLKDIAAAKEALRNFNEKHPGNGDLPGTGLGANLMSPQVRASLENSPVSGVLGIAKKGGVDVQSDLQRLTNLYVKSISGTRVSKEAYARDLKGLGTDPSIGTPLIRSKLKELETALDAAESEVTGAAANDYGQAYVDNLKANIENEKQKLKATKKSSGLTPDEQKELDELEKKHGGKK